MFSIAVITAGVAFLASCQPAAVPPTASEKSVGTYNGTFSATGIDTTGSVVVVANGDDMVNMTLSCPMFPPGSSINGVHATLNGDNVNFSFSSSSTTDGTVINLNTPTLTGNTLAFGMTVYFAAGNQIFGFSGQK